MTSRNSVVVVQYIQQAKRLQFRIFKASEVHAPE